jgi:hypothetical protein
MTDPAIPPVVLPDAPAAPRIGHELISFAVFLEYRARRMRAPVGSLPATAVTKFPSPEPGEP